MIDQCDTPPSRCHAHHVVPWSEGGRTDLDGLALLCWNHHTWLHQAGLTLRRVRGREEREQRWVVADNAGVIRFGPRNSPQEARHGGAGLEDGEPDRLFADTG